MGSGYVNHFGLYPENASWFYQYDDPRGNMLLHNPMNHVSPLHFSGAGHLERPNLYEPPHFFPYQREYLTNLHLKNLPQPYSHGAITNYSNPMPYGPQSRFFHHVPYPQDFVRFEDDIPMAQTQGLFVNHPSYFYSPGWSDGYLCSGYHMGDSSRNNFNNGITHYTYPQASSNQFNFFPMSHNGLEHYYPTLNHWIPRNDRGDFGDSMYINEDPYRCSRGSVSASKVFASRRAGLHNKSEIRVCNNGSSYDSGVNIAASRQYSGLHHGCENNFRNLPTKSSIASRTVRDKPGQAHQSEPTRSGKDLSPLVEISVTHKVSAPRDPKLLVTRSEIEKTSAPCQVWREKTKTEPSLIESEDCETSVGEASETCISESEDSAVSDSEDSETTVSDSGVSVAEDSETTVSDSGASVAEDSEHSVSASEDSETCQSVDFEQSVSESEDLALFHITWDGFDEGYFDEPREPIGMNCSLCQEDLTDDEPIDKEIEYHDIEISNLRKIAILACGHAFHSDCLLDVTPQEESTDPPCYLCLSVGDI